MSSDVHGGDLRATLKSLGLASAPEIRLDFSVNLNPLGPCEAVDRLLLHSDAALEEYPEIDAAKAEDAIAAALGLPKNSIIACAGATEAFELALRAAAPSKIAWTPPSYSGYQEICGKLGIADAPIACLEKGLVFEPDFEALKASDAKMIFLCSPSNPTGQLVEAAKIAELAQARPDAIILLDESFLDFSERAVETTFVKAGTPPNMLVVKSLTKFHCVAGLRVGFACGAPDLIAKMKSLRLPWSVNGLAQAAIKPMLSDAKHAAGSVVETKRLREHLVAGLKTLKGVAPCPSEANFVLCRLDAPRTASKLQRELLHEGILIRSCAGVLGLGEEWIRLAVRPEREEDELIDALREILGSSGEAPKTRTSRKAKSILVVGTTSDSGKSVSATALCRVFSDMGLKTAPFKAQNMSLNSFVTKEGGEMGRAQVVQAAAARVEPHTDMNPVLLKPLGDARSQVIVDGQPVRNAGAREYYTYKDELGKRARDAFDRLAARNDVIVMEGAGSPTEINLLENDFVNMRMAEHAQAPTILVADIDRGGVFASIYGTIRLLPPKWRKLISGVVINKFRGDKSLLDPGVAEIERLTGVPILGVVPFIHSLDVDEEDSLGLKKRNSAAKALIDIAVLRLPMLSNFTDFAAFEAAPSVAVRYVSSPKHLGSPDMLIIPGSKNTIHDMLHLRESGFEARIKEYRDKGGFIVGVCGGYQIMGERIDDPLGLEGPDKSCPGLGILPCATVMEPRKELAQVSGMAYPPLPFLKGGCPFHGYEIHCGRTSCEKAEAPLKILSRGGATCEESVGSIAPDGLAFGSYIHGIFDSDELRAKLLNWLCERKGVDPEELLAQTPRAEAQEKEIQRLAKTFKENVDIDRVLSWLELPGR